jgi:hypothetical protein
MFPDDTFSEMLPNIEATGCYFCQEKQRTLSKNKVVIF